MPENFDSWTRLHDLAVVYLALAHGTDAMLTEEELEVMTNKLGDWAPEAERETLEEVIMEALAVYMNEGRDKTVESAILRVRSDMNMLEKLAALDDLVKIAKADGKFIASEEELIGILARVWGVRSEDEPS